MIVAYVVRPNIVSEGRFKPFVVLGMGLDNAKYNAENFLLKRGEVMWAQLVVSEATPETLAGVLGTDIGHHVLTGV